MRYVGLSSRHRPEELKLRATKRRRVNPARGRGQWAEQRGVLPSELGLSRRFRANGCPAATSLLPTRDGADRPLAAGL